MCSKKRGKPGLYLVVRSRQGLAGVVVIVLFFVRLVLDASVVAEELSFYKIGRGGVVYYLSCSRHSPYTHILLYIYTELPS